MTSDAAPPPPAIRRLPEIVLDLRGLRCPMPVLRTRKALVGLGPGQLLRVTCTDPLAGLDLPHLVHETGDVLVGAERSGAAQVFLIRKG